MKAWSEFGFITPGDGGEDVYIHCKQLIDTKVLQQGDTVAYDTEHDKRKGKYKAVNCASHADTERLRQ